MKSIVSMVWAASWSVCCFAVAAAQAGDLGPIGAPAGAPTSSKVDQEINQAVGASASAQPTDLDKRINDLDATRTEIDQKRPPTISLGVSGWVNEQYSFKP